MLGLAGHSRLTHLQKTSGAGEFCHGKIWLEPRPYLGDDPLSLGDRHTREN